MNVVVYTTLLGGCDTLKPAPAGATRSVCYTDDRKLTKHAAVDGWEIKPWTVRKHPRADSRELQVSNHLFDGADLVVWVDASCTLFDLPKFVADSGDAELVGLHHPKRKHIYEEGAQTIKLGQSPRGLVEKQMRDYRRFGFTEKSGSLTATSLFGRRQTARVTAFNTLWAEQLRKYGQNDQMSFDFSAWAVGLEVKHLTGDYKNGNPYMKYDMKGHGARRKPGWDPS